MNEHETEQAAMEFVAQLMEEAPESVSTPEDVRQIIEDYKAGAGATVEEILARFGFTPGGAA